jgi:hypothetical protein
LEMGDIGAGGVGSRQRGMFAGVRAKTADFDALDNAKNMEGQGASRDQIWNETGWFKDVDNQWKFEIDDSQATFNAPDSVKLAQQELERQGYRFGDPRTPEAATDAAFEVANSKIESLRVGDALSNDNLRQAYPDLMNLELDLFSSDSGLKGYATEGMIGVRDSQLGQGQSGQLSTALHELQHKVQRDEGFAEGGSSSVLAWADQNQRPQLVQEYDRLKADIQTPMSFEDYQSRAWGGEPVSDEMKVDYDQYLQQLRSMPISKDLDRDFQRTAARNIYERLAGEAEARNVETRRDFTPQQRRDSTPWSTLDVPENELIIRRARGNKE